MSLINTNKFPYIEITGGDANSIEVTIEIGNNTEGVSSQSAN